MSVPLHDALYWRVLVPPRLVREHAIGRMDGWPRISNRSRYFNVHKMIGHRYANWVALIFLLAISCILFLQALGNPHITRWDEAVHVNVVKNLAEHCCMP